MSTPTSVSELLDRDALACATAVTAGDVSPLELVDAAIDRIESRDPVVHALSWERFERARAEATQHDRSGLFAGVPILLKDLDTPIEGEPTYEGSHVLRDADVRGEVTAPLVDKLRAAGFIILGASRASEFGVAAITVPPGEPPVGNPWAPHRNAGGSSGGAAAAVASGMVPCAHGSDGAGSIRIPASFCGLVGLKASRGRVSSGPIATGSGPATELVLSRTIRDTAAAVDVLSGALSSDSIVAPPPQQSFLSSIDRPATGLRIGVMTSYPGGNGVVDPANVAAVERAASLLADLGHTIVDDHPDVVDELDWMIDALGVLLAVECAGVAQQLEAMLGRPPTSDELEPMNLAFAHRGAAVTGLQFAEALGCIGELSYRSAMWWDQGFDVLIHPVSAGRSPLSADWAYTEADASDEGGWNWYVRMAHYIAFTPAWNLTGQPSLTVPVMQVDGLPAGIQIVGRYGREDTVLGVGRQLELASPWPLVAPWPPASAAG
jgi:amidase